MLLSLLTLAATIALLYLAAIGGYVVWLKLNGRCLIVDGEYLSDCWRLSGSVPFGRGVDVVFPLMLGNERYRATRAIESPLRGKVYVRSR